MLLSQNIIITVIVKQASVYRFFSKDQFWLIIKQCKILKVIFENIPSQND